MKSLKAASGVRGCLACTWPPSFHDSVANNSPSRAVNVWAFNRVLLCPSYPGFGVI